MDRRKAFASLLESAPEPKLRFTNHFDIRQLQRNLGRKEIEDWIFHRQTELVHVEEAQSSRGLQRFRLFYRYSKKKLLTIVVDRDTESVFCVVTFVIDKKERMLKRFKA
ncbi:MAG: hypothetical protein WC408_05340 [Candidatus Micrarchaeia archaeon]